MKRLDYMKKIDEENEYGIIELACMRKMQMVGENVPCKNADADNCYPEKCRQCVIDYLDEEVDENGKAVGCTGQGMGEHNECSQGDS